MPTTPLATPTTGPVQQGTRRSVGAEVDSASESFGETLDQQALDRVAASLRLSAPEGQPNAILALAGAGAAPPADATDVASQQLVSQQRQQSTRDRGQDAASASANELRSRPAAAPALATSPSSQTAPTIRDDRGTRLTAEGPVSTARAEGPGRSGARAAEQSETRSLGSGGSAASASPIAPGRPEAGNAAVSSATPQSRVAAVQAVHRLSGAGAGMQNAQPAASGGGGSRAGNTPVFSLERLSSRQADLKTAQAAPARAAPEPASAQVQRGLAQVLRQQGGALTLKLTPHELGEVRVALQINQQRVSGTIETRTSAARDLLNQNLDALKASLEQRGVTVDRLEVRLQGAAESDQRPQTWAEARHTDARAHADTGGDRPSGHAGSEDRSAGSRDGSPGRPERDADSGASAPDQDDGHGRPVELAGGWLRLDTTV
ncbi:MAG: flagellar hook-length control protein FliK [Planctomycetota bacterium]